MSDTSIFPEDIPAHLHTRAATIVDTSDTLLAWRYEDIEQVIEFLDTQHFAITAIEVYGIYKDELFPAGESWQMESRSDWLQYQEESIQKASKYIKHYQSITTGEHYYLLSPITQKRWDVQRLLPTNFPDELRASAEPLTEYGINEIAWKYTDALKVLAYLVQHGYVISGGDVYQKENGIFNFTCNTWAFDIYGVAPEKHSEESYRKAVEYISLYQKQGDSYYFSFVF